ncbi:MAG: heme A synthase [Proteobacteria bacterium]|nr:heme A synthase [Pseudomonadota bacterium]
MQHQMETPHSGSEGMRMGAVISGTRTSQKRFRAFAIANLAYTLLVIVWGAYVRATGSGAGCGEHWPLCNGEVIPRPERIQTLIEFAHRSTSGISLLLVAGGYLWARKVATPGSAVRRLAGWSVVAILLEAALGAGLVLLKLVEFDQSAARAVSIALHLVNTLFLVSCLTSIAWAASRGPLYREPAGFIIPRSRLFRFTLACFAVLGVTGAITALGDTLFPASSLASGFGEDFSPGAHFLVRLRVFHPVIAVLWVMLVFFWSRHLETFELMRSRGRLLLAVIVQFMIGFVNWMLMAPTGLQLLHLLAADLVFVAFWISGLNHETRESRITA